MRESSECLVGKGAGWERCHTAGFFALVSDEQAARLAGATPPGAHLHCLEDWAQLDGIPALLPDAVIIDPLAGDGPSGDLRDTLQAIAGTAQLIVYTSLTPLAMRRLLQLPIPAGTRLLLAGQDDGPKALRAVLSNIQTRAHRLLALEELRDRAGPLPAEVAQALGDLLRGADRRLTVDRLARMAHMSARTLERRLSEAHAPPPLWLIRATRALMARELLNRSPLTVQGVMREVGYAKPGSLRALLRWFFDATPSRLRRGPARTPGPRWNAGPSEGSR
jgi:AraC-like DNA-binding protein